MSSAALPPQPHTVLVVDDQDLIRRLLRRHLEEQGYRVLLAGNGAEALQRVHSEPVDVVLLDVVMRGLDGYEVCRQLKGDPRTMFIPVVMVTILSDREARIRAIESGADEFLSKPVYREELLARVRSLIRWQEARRELDAAREAQIRRVFSRYLCPKVVEDILASPESELRALLDATRRTDAVVLFTDLRGFTALSEHIPAGEMVEVLNEYFAEMTRAAHAREGTIFNMSGDSLLVAFGVPFEQADAADRALDAAVEMQRVFRRLSSALQARYGEALGLGIGINSGEVVVGNVGSEHYMNYTVIGDTVNVAARLQGMAAAGEILLAESAVDALSGRRPDLCEAVPRPVRLKGRSGTIRIFRCRAPLSGGDASASERRP